MRILSYVNRICALQVLLLLLLFPWLAFIELEQIGNLVLRQNLNNVPCSSSAPSLDASRPKDLLAFLYIKIRH